MKIIKVQILIILLALLMGCNSAKFEREETVQQLNAFNAHSYNDEHKTPLANQETDEDKTTLVNQLIDENYNKLFEFEVFSDKDVYKTTDKIEIWATLKYIGNDNQIEIWHGKPYINFKISDGKEFNTGWFRHDILTSTILDKDEIYKFDYAKSGGFSEDDPKADFWRMFYSEKDLYLPEGEYTIKAIGDFSLTQDIQESKSNLSSELKIKVIE
ncbi:UNVERIFIED_CONTAM: hypothetical protein Cloal_2357 [Acetivibrio alkalicellulosi]